MERVRDLLPPQIKVPGVDIDDQEDMLRRLSDALADPPPAKDGDDIKIEIDSSATASDRVVSQTKDFAMMSADEMQVALFFEQGSVSETKSELGDTVKYSFGSGKYFNTPPVINPPQIEIPNVVHKAAN